MDLDSIIAIFAAFTAISTMTLVVSIIHLANINNKLWLAQDKPWLNFRTTYVSVIIGETRRRQVLHVKNIGKGPALEITFKIGPVDEPVSISSLSPGQEESVNNIHLPDEFQIKEISYNDINGVKIRQKTYNTRW